MTCLLNFGSGPGLKPKLNPRRFRLAGQYILSKLNFVVQSFGLARSIKKYIYPVKLHRPCWPVNNNNY